MTNGADFFLITIKISEAASESNLPPEELLDVYVDIKEKISSRRNDTIESVFLERWKYGYSDGASLYHRMSVELIFEIVQNFLYECCRTKQHPPFFDLDTYKKHYSQSLIDYLKFHPSEISEEDFIKEELEHCKLIKEELKKPVYYIRQSRDSRNFYNFATLLESRMDKRISFLRSKLSSLHSQITYPNSTNQGTAAKYTIRQIALLSIYQREHITRNNANEIAKQHGHTSGEKLFQHYTHYSSQSNRKGYPGSQVKLLNKIDLLESVVLLLPDDKREKAQDELAILKLLRDKEN